MFSISMDKIERVFRDFYNVTRFKIVLFNAERRVITSYPTGMCRFCREVRGCSALAEECRRCDERGFDMCDQTRQPYIYQCHLGVFEAIAPIYAGDMNAGYLMFGQIRPGDATEIKKAAARVNAKHGTCLTDEMIDEMTEADEAFIGSAVNMMTMCASYLYTAEIIRDNPNVLVYQLKEYVRAHLGGDLSLEAICRDFYISRSKLYHLSREAFGMGITQYVRAERIREAKRLLRGGDLSVSEIARAVGIPDDNYFIRLFRATEGMTPLRYRKG
ncbi:MAG: PocR ligand-binding domain-containing protein [Clostridia bacterium]|nr:PocR ligand-binding domain-containing protein [Clostridia bacterium]